MKKPQVPILFFLLSFPIVLGVLYTAALPLLTNYFQVTKGQGQETVSLYLIGCLLGQFVYATLSNAIGRKPAIYVGCGLSLLGCLLCIISIEMKVFSLLLFGRALTAFGASCGLLLTNTLIADSFSVTESKKILSYLMTGFAIFPAVSIALGGFITEYLAWEDCFYVMLIYAIFITALCILLPETGKERHISHLKITKIVRSYSKQVRNCIAMLYALVVAAAGMFFYVFSAEAPFIAINQLHISPNHFGLYNLIPSVGLLVGGLVAAHTGHKISSKITLLMGSSVFLFFSIIMWFLFGVGFVNILTLFGVPLFIFFVTPAILSNGQALSVAASEDKAYASSTLYIVQYCWMLLSITILSLLKGEKGASLPIVYTISGALMITLLIVLHFIPQKHHV
jgi:DHA1 family bicyclomycin/chloramphenicol resistance-like MFS transporter